MPVLKCFIRQATAGAAIGMILFSISWSQVNEAWIGRFNGSGPNSADYGTDIAFDWEGSVIVTGYAQMDSSLRYDIATIKYSTDGEMLWSNTASGLFSDPDRQAFLAIDNIGNAYVLAETGTDIDTSFNDIVLLKYSDNGVLQWEATYDNPYGGIFAPFGIKLDADGNIYICASVAANADTGDVITIKYNSDGAMVWNSAFTGRTWSHYFKASMAVDPQGNAYLAIPTIYTDSLFGTIIVKYDSAGRETWAMPMGNPDTLGDTGVLPRCIGLDAAGNIYVGGKFFNHNGEILFYVMSYSSAGRLRWTADFSGYDGPETDNGLAVPYAMVVNGNGNVAITGPCYHYVEADSSVCYSYATVKYDSSGHREWAAFYNGVHAYSLNYPSDIAEDGWGNYFVTGGSYDYRNDRFDYATVKYSSSGNEESVMRHDGPGSRNDWSYAVAAGPGGDFAVTGICDEGIPHFTNDNILTIKYVQEGQRISEIKLPEPFIIISAYPNPFNTQVEINYNLLKSEKVELSIYNVLGQKITTLFEGIKRAGKHETTWDANEFSSGVYFARLEAGEKTNIVRMILLK